MGGGESRASSSGNAQECLAELEAASAAGVSEALPYLSFGGCPHGEALTSLERAAVELVPHV